ncbi:MAG: D-aminoacyl-tRNA deacylase [Planctomycetota bacterium]|jgi:D-tyrosyl-tRNA(Tyr) deacylase
MRAVIQRVTQASVTVEGQVVGAIDHGLVVLLGVERGDDEAQAAWLAGKIAGLRIFNDDAGRFNQSVVDVAGRCLVVSQFTLVASTRKGTRPSFAASAAPELAEPLYERFVALLADASGQPVATGRFAAHMDVALINDGPVTITIDSQRRE